MGWLGVVQKWRHALGGGGQNCDSLWHHFECGRRRVSSSNVTPNILKNIQNMFFQFIQKWCRTGGGCGLYTNTMLHGIHWSKIIQQMKGWQKQRTTKLKNYGEKTWNLWQCVTVGKGVKKLPNLRDVIFERSLMSKAQMVWLE